MIVTINYFKDSGKWQGELTYESDFKCWQTNRIEVECKIKFPILNKYNFTIELESIEESGLVWNSYLILKSV